MLEETVLRVLRRLEPDQEPVLLRLNDKNLIVEVELTGGAFGPGRTRIELRGHKQKSGFLVPEHVKVFSGEPESEDLRQGHQPRGNGRRQHRTAVRQDEEQDREDDGGRGEDRAVPER